MSETMREPALVGVFRPSGLPLNVAPTVMPI
jgi:hypothetical protein